MHQRAKASAQAVFTTGASRGIGFDCARFLAERGYRSLGSVRRERDLDRLREAGIEPVLMDVADRASVLRAGVEVERLLAGTRLRALVNNAGVPAAGPIELADLDEARSVFEVNFFGTLAVTRTFLPLLRASGGRVINMSSLFGALGVPVHRHLRGIEARARGGLRCSPTRAPHGRGGCDTDRAWFRTNIYMGSD